MTRINCVPVEELNNKMLLAEYRELPRVYRQAEKAFQRGDTAEIPDYRMGTGHVRFFYTRLGYCTRRHRELVAEMQARGFTTNYAKPPAELSVPRSWLQDWTPDYQAMQINRARIAERLAP